MDLEQRDAQALLRELALGAGLGQYGALAPGQGYADNGPNPLYYLTVPGYETLAGVLRQAYAQAADGKGKERHANGNAFDEQPMTTINAMLGSVDGFLYQAIKKTVESKRLPKDRAVAELLGAINYLAGAVIALEK